MAVTHGTPSAYNRGCRCYRCTQANSERSRARRQRVAIAKLAGVDPSTLGRRQARTETTTTMPVEYIEHYDPVLYDNTPEVTRQEFVSTSPVSTFPERRPVVSGVLPIPLVNTGRRRLNPSGRSAGAYYPENAQRSAKTARRPEPGSVEDYNARLSAYLAGHGPSPTLTYPYGVTIVRPMTEAEEAARGLVIPERHRWGR